MGCWSAENAAKAYIRTMKMGEHAKELNGAEFISALAAGNNSQFMVVVCASTADSTMLALAAAAQQTRGRVICIIQGQEEQRLSNLILGTNPGSSVEFVTGDAQKLLMNHYKEADFLAIDCNLKNHEDILRSVQGATRYKDAIVLGYNAFCKQSWRTSSLHTDLLPIGEGLLLTRTGAKTAKVNIPRTQERSMDHQSR